MASLFSWKRNARGQRHLLLAPRMSPAAPFVWVVVGSPGSGKSSLIRIALDEASRKKLRVMIFDPMREFSGFGSLAGLESIRQHLSHVGPFALVYQPDTSDPEKLKQKFDVFCKLAFVAGDLLCVVDEAADVTSPNRYEVPEGWSTLLRQGRHRAVRILAATQRPADIDKRLWTFATRIRTGRLNYSSDQAELANVLNVDRDDIAALIERQWIERDMLTGVISRGSIEWVKGKPLQVLEPGRATPGGPAGRDRHRAVNPALGDAAPNRVAPARRGKPAPKKIKPRRA